MLPSGSPTQILAMPRELEAGVQRPPARTPTLSDAKTSQKLAREKVDVWKKPLFVGRPGIGEAPTVQNPRCSEMFRISIQSDDRRLRRAGCHHGTLGIRKDTGPATSGRPKSQPSEGNNPILVNGASLPMLPHTAILTGKSSSSTLAGRDNTRSKPQSAREPPPGLEVRPLYWLCAFREYG